jgi:hypothetical protein
MTRQRVIVSFDLSQGAVTDLTLGRLRAAGLVVDVGMEAMGVVIGEASPDDIPAIRAVPGVVSVEPDRTISLPTDPDAPQ